MAQELREGQSAIDLSSLHTFAVGQVLASVAGGISYVAFNFFNSGIPLAPVTLPFVIASAGAIPAMLVSNRTSRWRVTTATYMFVLSATLATAISLFLFGVKTGVPTLFIWPILTAAMLLGFVYSGATAILCAITVATFFILQSNGIVIPLIDNNGSTFGGAAATVLSIIGTAVAGGTIRKALVIARAQAQAMDAAFTDLRRANASAISVTSDAKELASDLGVSSNEQ